MAEVSKTLVEMVDERPNIDNSEAFAQLWDIYSAARQQFDQRFKVSMDPCCADLVPEYEGLPGIGARGMLSVWSGPEIDWFVHSWIGNPKYSFTNMHFTAWLGHVEDEPAALVLFRLALGAVHGGAAVAVSVPGAEGEELGATAP